MLPVAKPEAWRVCQVVPRPPIGLICQMESQTQHIVVARIRFIIAISILCLATIEILKGKQVDCYKLYYLYSIGTANHPSQLWNGGNTLKAKFPDTSQGLPVQPIRPSTSKDSSLGLHKGLSSHSMFIAKKLQSQISTLGSLMF